MSEKKTDPGYPQTDQEARQAISAYCASHCRRRLAATVQACEHSKCHLYELRGGK